MNNKYYSFKNTVMEYYGEYGRHDLPWRKKQSPYYVLVSEIMLQQTQVDRVVPFFKTWMKTFPNLKKLANAKQSDVLRLWKGLGYNSRALRLQKCAQEIVKTHNGKIPSDYKKLIALPGIGPYTAGAIMNFAFNIWTPIIETNIRRVFIHHFFKDLKDITDNEILDFVKDVGYYDEPCIWMAALMDYGSTLPKIIKHNPNTQSKHYTKQSKFAGSNRQIRGQILEILLNEKNHKISQQKLFKKLGSEYNRYEKILEKMSDEGFLEQQKNGFILK